MDTKESNSVETPSENLLTVLDLAAAWKVRPGTIYAKVARREIPFIKVGSLVRFRKADLDRHLSAHTVAPVRPSKGVHRRD